MASASGGGTAEAAPEASEVSAASEAEERDIEKRQMDRAMMHLATDVTRYLDHEGIVVRCYLSDGSEADHHELVGAVNEFARELGFRMSFVREPELGSLYQEIFLKAIHSVSKTEVAVRVRKIVRAIAGTDSLDSVKGLVALLEKTDAGVIQVNEWLVVKVTTSDGKTSTVIRELTESEQDWIRDDEGLLRSPLRLLEELDASREAAKERVGVGDGG